MNTAYSITAADLAARGASDIPPQLVSGEHLIYSSPATLAFNSPGAQGFGVKRAGLAVPGSVMLLVSPGCCGRNTTALSAPEYRDRFFYLLQDETDIVTGRHLSRIPQAVQEVCKACREKPSVVMICITCVDALLGTDMDRVCRKAEEAAGVPVRPCYMYALTREGRLPPMASVRKTVYSLLEPRKKRADAANILGYFSPLRDGSELYALLRQAGLRHIREISRCGEFEEYRAMAEANFNLVLHPESRPAAQDLQERLGIPAVELTRCYQMDKIQNQYRLLGQIIGAELDDARDFDETAAVMENFRKKYGALSFAVGEMSNAEPFELALALTRQGFSVPEIFGTVGAANFPYIKKLARLSPETKIYSNLSPSMLFYDNGRATVDAAIGKDASYYHPGCPGVLWSEERQPFGYEGVRALFGALDKAMEETR
jgi:nitrogenase molybdenum-cofactor synthesis protein NifE